MLLAQAELERRRRERAEREGLLEFFARVSPHLNAPSPLGPFVDVIERASRGEAVRVVVSTPPQHGKTLTAIHGLIWWLLRDGSRRNAYVTYEAQRAWDVSGDALALAQEVGLKVTGGRRRWVTGQGGGLFATGIGGPLTGYPVDGLLLIDDPVKNLEEAESATYRERAIRWFQTTAMTRVHRNASVIVIQTRWHPDDLAGFLIKSGWNFVNLPAVNDGSDSRRALGEPLDPARWPLDLLEERRKEIGEYAWASLYQGQPRPREGSLFNGVWHYDALPKRGWRVAIGLDLAYSARTKSDYSVAVVLMEAEGVYYVVDVIRGQMLAPGFAGKLAELRVRYPSATPLWYCAGAERGVADLLGALGTPVSAVQATADKFVRGQPVSAAWNRGAVLVPREAPWLSSFVGEVTSFTGLGDAHDDIVDALAAAYDLLAAPTQYRNLENLVV